MEDPTKAERLGNLSEKTGKKKAGGGIFAKEKKAGDEESLEKGNKQGTRTGRKKTYQGNRGNQGDYLLSNLTGKTNADKG